MDNTTFKEKVVLRLTPRLIVILFTTLIISLIALTISLVAFTPLREYIPGYGSEQNNHKLILLQAKTDAINKVLAEITAYEQDVKTVLTAGTFKDDTIDLKQKADVPTEKARFAFSEYDSILMQVEGKKTDKLPKNILTHITQKNRKPSDLFFAPVNGVILQAYNSEVKGIKISCTKDSSVFAPLEGTVIYMDYNLKTGACIVIHHQGNIITTYQQAGRPKVEAGDFVKPKQIISTLQADTPLTFKLWLNGDYVNPEEYILF
jgi:septal ring factor EnvC (AmiA/AmiB activator)